MATAVPVISGANAFRTPNSANVRRMTPAARSTGSRIANAVRGFVARAWIGGGQAATMTRPRNQFMRDGSAGYLSSWNPALRDSPDEVRSVWTKAAARAIDALHNSGWLAGGIDQASADTIGAGLRLNATPDIDVLGWTDEYRAEWSSRVERRWRAWSNDPLECDARGKRTISELTDAAIRQHFAFGEATALLPQIARNISRTTTKVLMVSPHRLAQETNAQTRLAQGVFVDGNGLPLAYRFKRASTNGLDESIDIRARSADGRPQVIHVFDGTPDQVRGISPLAPILKVVRQHDQLTDATLTAALIQTIIAATVTSPELSDEVFQGLADDAGELPDEIAGYLQAKSEWWSGRALDLGAHGKIAHLFPGETFDIKSPANPGDNYLPFVRNLLREIARCIGVTYESLTGDYDGATYSSVRMATAAIWAITMRRRQRIAVPFVAPIYRTWLEEEIRTGAIEFPGGYEAFKRNRVAATQAEWQGPAKPTADDLKTAKASTERLASATTSLTYECGEIGLDVETVMRDRARESHLAKSLGLPDPHAARLATGAYADNPDGSLKEAA